MKQKEVIPQYETWTHNESSKQYRFRIYCFADGHSTSDFITDILCISPFASPSLRAHTHTHTHTHIYIYIYIYIYAQTT